VPIKVASARYMTRFRCLAGECEATCCGGWGIAVEPAAHRRLKVLAGGDEALGQLIERGIELTPEGPDYARLRFLESGACSMLDDGGLCGIQAKFGHEALFDVCAAYPRSASEIDGELELFGTLSCPEVARLALLPEDGFEIESVDFEEAPRKLRNRFDTRRAYFRHFRLVRAATLRLLADPAYTLSDKLFVSLWMGDQLKPLLHQGCNDVPEAELQALFSALAKPQVLSALTSSFRALDIDGALPIMILHAALRPSAHVQPGAQQAHFDAILREVWGAYGLANLPGAAPSEAELSAVWARYRALLAEVPSAAGVRVEACLTRYALNHVLTTPYMLSENLFEYAYDLVVRVASLRFLSYTRLARFAGSAKELDESIVEVAFSFGRAVEHAELPRRLQGMLAAQGLSGLAHAVCFLAI
jgi:lysine-N-methylase